MSRHFDSVNIGELRTSECNQWTTPRSFNSSSGGFFSDCSRSGGSSSGELNFCVINLNKAYFRLYTWRRSVLCSGIGVCLGGLQWRWGTREFCLEKQHWKNSLFFSENTVHRTLIIYPPSKFLFWYPFYLGCFSYRRWQPSWNNQCFWENVFAKMLLSIFLL